MISGVTKERVVSTTTWERMKSSPLGGRAGFSIPICGHECVRLTAMGGYMPSPDTATFSLGVAY